MAGSRRGPAVQRPRPRERTHMKTKTGRSFCPPPPEGVRTGKPDVPQISFPGVPQLPAAFPGPYCPAAGAGACPRQTPSRTQMGEKRPKAATAGPQRSVHFASKRIVHPTTPVRSGASSPASPPASRMHPAIDPDRPAHRGTHPPGTAGRACRNRFRRPEERPHPDIRHECPATRQPSPEGRGRTGTPDSRRASPFAARRSNSMTVDIRLHTPATSALTRRPGRSRGLSDEE